VTRVGGSNHYELGAQYFGARVPGPRID